MADNTPFRVKRSALPSSVQQLFNPKNCFAMGELTMDAERNPVLTGNCQVMQFGKNHTGNDCMFVCQYSDKSSYRPVLASFVFNHEGRVIESYFGNSDATPSWETHINDGTRASFGYLPPPPPPPQPQPQHPDSTVLSRITAINDLLKDPNTRNQMSKGDIAALNHEKHELKVRLDKEAEEAAQAAKAAQAAALDTYAARLNTPTWGCTSVLKGPLKFIGCQRSRDHHSGSLVDGYPYVECVTTSANFDAKLDTSPENIGNIVNIGKITPYFKYDPVTGNTMYGASGHEYYDTVSLGGNVLGNQGFQSFVVSNPNDESMHPMETRQGSCPHPKSVPPNLSALNPNTQIEWKRRLMKGNESLRDQMKALKWLADNPLEFPTHALGLHERPIDAAFAHEAFGWVRNLSIQFKPSRLSLPSADMTKMSASSTHASHAAMHPSAMRAELFKRLTAQPFGSIGVRPLINTCNCTPTNRNPRCLNHLCPFKHTRLARLQFEWPTFELLDSGDPAARSALDREILGAAASEARAATAKQQAAEAAEEKQRAADAARDAKNARAKAQRRLAAASASALAPARRASRPSAAALASAVAPARGTKRAPESAASAPESAASAPESAASASASAASASAGPASASASTTTKKKKKGGSNTKSKSKSKSKRRFHNHK